MAELKQRAPRIHLPHGHVTHGVTAVAELKPRLRNSRCTSSSLRVTHGVTAVAELKLSEAAQYHLELAVTHGVTAVAELKPPPPMPAAGVEPASPTASPPWPN